MSLVDTRRDVFVFVFLSSVTIFTVGVCTFGEVASSSSLMTFRS